jgi:hypothetical protein
MTFYVALVAIVNLALGYALAVFLQNARVHVAPSADETYDETYGETYDDSYDEASTEEWETEPETVPEEVSV